MRLPEHSLTLERFPGEILDTAARIPWIDAFLGLQINQECSTFGRSSRLCVNHVISDNEIPGRKGLAISWVTLPAEAISLEVTSVKMKGPLPLGKNDLAILSGGFWQGSFDNAVPDGLLIEQGRTVSSLALWKNGKTDALQGGILLQRSGTNEIAIVPPSGFDLRDRPITALQSKPLLIEGGRVSVYDSHRDHAWNRACVGLDQANELVLVVATGDHSYALTQYEFAYVVSKLPKLKGPVLAALGMDGAFAPSLVVARGNRRFGSSIANTASFIHVRERAR